MDTNAILGAILTPFAVIAWHFGQLNSLTLYSGVWVDSWFLPKAVLLNRWHLRGAACAALGTLIIVASMFFGLLDYGIFVGGALILPDVFCSYLAIRDYKKSKRRSRKARASA